MSDPTREAAKTDESLHNEVTWTLMRNFIVMGGDTASQRAVYERTAEGIIADVRAAFLASPPDWLAKGAADERAKCIAAVEALMPAEDTQPYVRVTIRSVLQTLRSLSPLGLPTTEREQKK